MFGFGKKAKPLIMPEPAWDGEHRLTGIRFVEEEGTGMGDYYKGYRWVCSCTLMSPASPPSWYASEERAAQGHANHRAAYERPVRKWGTPREFYEFPPGRHQ